MRPAHYTVSEYLMSARIHTSPVKIFALAQESEDTSLAKICLKYLLRFNNSEPLSAAINAVGNDRIEVVDCLLEAGADPDIEAEWEGGSASEAGPDPDPGSEVEWVYESTSGAGADFDLDLVREYSTFEAALRNGRPDIYKRLISAPPIWKDIKRSASERRKATGRRFQARHCASGDDIHTQKGNSNAVSWHALKEVKNRDG